MAIPPLPPLRIREADGSPNVIPVFDIILSTNLVAQNRGGGVIAISAQTGAAGGSTPGGSDTQIQINSASTLTGYSGLRWDNTGSTLRITGDITLVSPSDRTIRISDQTLAGSAGNILNILGASGQGTGGVGGHIFIVAGSGGTQAVGGDFNMQAGDGGIGGGTVNLIAGTASSGGPGGEVFLQAGNAGGNANAQGGNIGMQLGNAAISGSMGYVYIFNASGNATQFLFDKITGTRNLNVPDSSGTLAINSRYPILLSSGGNLSISTGATGQILITSGGVSGDLAWVNSSGGASGVIYAPTGGFYVTWSADTLLSSEKILTGSDNIVVTTGANNVWISATTNPTTGTAGLVQSSRTISTIYPISGGGDLSVDRTHAVDTAFLVNSGRTISTTYPLSGGGNLSADRTLFIQTGQTGQVLITSGGVTGSLAWVNSTGGASGAVYAATGDTFLVYSASTGLTNERVIAASDNITIVSSGTSFLISATTGASGGGGTQIIRIPMSLLTVEVNSGNAYWTAATDTTRMDRAYVNMSDSGRSVSTWWCTMPTNLNATPAWGVDIYSQAVVGGSAGGFIVLNVDGMTATINSSANTLAASTIQLLAATSFQLNTADILSMSTLTATNFDSALATSATNYTKIKIARQGNADTLNSDWWIYSVQLKCTVNT